MLRAENLTCHRGGRTLLDHLDLHVLPGETVALLGPAGAGKTAVLEVFAGRLPVAAGRAIVAGSDLVRDPAAAFAAVAYIPAAPVFAPAVSGLGHLEEVCARLGRRIPVPVLRATLERSGLAPPVAAQLLLARRAGTDLEAHLAYLDRVRAFHGAMKAHFHPPVFAETVLPVASWRDFPRFVPAAPPAAAGTFAERLPLLLPLGLGLAVAVRALRRPFRPLL